MTGRPRLAAVDISPKKWTTIGAAVCALGLVLSAGCAGRSVEEILRKSQHVGTRADLEKAIGQPTDIAKQGADEERWTYKASDGDVVFAVRGNDVALQATTLRTKK